MTKRRGPSMDALGMAFDVLAVIQMMLLVIAIAVSQMPLVLALVLSVVALLVALGGELAWRDTRRLARRLERTERRLSSVSLALAEERQSGDTDRAMPEAKTVGQFLERARKLHDQILEQMMRAMRNNAVPGATTVSCGLAARLADEMPRVTVAQWGNDVFAHLFSDPDDPEGMLPGLISVVTKERCYHVARNDLLDGVSADA